MVLTKSSLKSLATVVVLSMSAFMAGCGGGGAVDPFAPPPATPQLVVNPSSLTVVQGASALLTIASGVAPFQAFSSNSFVLPVTQAVADKTISLSPVNVTADTVVTITIRDAASQSTTVAVTVKPPVIPALVINPTALTVYSGIPSVLTIERGVGPFQAFSSDSLVLPVVQAVSGTSVFLVASSVSSDTIVTITLRDAAGQTVTVPVTVKPKPIASALVVTPTVLNIYSGATSQISINSGVGPFQVFSSDTAVLPVTQAVAGNAITLNASTVSVDTVVTLTVRDAAAQTATITVTVKPSPVLGVISVTRSSNSTCGGAPANTLDRAAICSGETGVASITVRSAVSVLPNRQVRFEVVQGAFNFVVDQSGVVFAKTITVVTDQNGKADVVIRTDAGVPSQAALIRATDLTSGNRVDGAFTIVQATNGSAILSVLPPTYSGSGGLVQECLAFSGDYVIYGGTAPYTITNGLPNAGTLSTTTSSGQVISVANQGGIFRFTSFAVADGCGGFTVPITIADAAGRVTSVTFAVAAGTAPRVVIPAVLSPAAVTFKANLGGSPAVAGVDKIDPSCSDGAKPQGTNCPVAIYTASSCGSGTVNSGNNGCVASVLSTNCGAGTVNGANNGCLPSVITTSASCGTGTLNSGNNGCIASVFTPASCSAGGTVTGNTCVPAPPASVFTPASCSNGGTVSGGACTQPTFTAAVCSNGGVANGNSCIQPIFGASCSNGGTLSGSSCTTPTFAAPTCSNNLFTSSLRTACEPSFYRGGSAAIPAIPLVPPSQCSSSSVVYTINGGFAPYVLSSSNAAVTPPTAVISTSPSNITITFPILNVGAVVTITAVDAKGSLFTSLASCVAGT